MKRRRAYDLPILHGDPEHVARDSLLLGTALSAPVTMLVAQGTAIRMLGRDGRAPADRILGALGAAMVVGYLGESLVRRRLLQPSSFDPQETPVIVVGLSLAAAMAALGLRDGVLEGFERAPHENAGEVCAVLG